MVSLNSPALVHIGIVTYNSLDDLPNCFVGIHAQTYPAIQITVLDNASSDTTIAWLEQYAPDIRLIRSQENTGFAKGHNQILRACHLRLGDFYLPLNPDVTLTPTYVNELVYGTQQYQAGWATGKLCLPETGKIYSVGHALRRDGYALNIGYHLPDQGQFEATREVFGAPGAAVLISDAMIQALAPTGELFDSDMFMYGEDTDLDWRARLQGWRCWYIPTALAYHRGSSPNNHLRDLALANRYLSVIKNAFWHDLLFYNLPRIIIHCATRLILTPKRGFFLTHRLLTFGLKMRRKRQEPMISRDIMMDWFRWSANQTTGQPISVLARLQAFLWHKK